MKNTVIVLSYLVCIGVLVFLFSAKTVSNKIESSKPGVVATFPLRIVPAQPFNGVVVVSNIGASLQPASN